MTSSGDGNGSAPPGRRASALLDTARGAALDCDGRPTILAGTWSSWAICARERPKRGWLKIYARAIATTFLFIVGVSLVLANTAGDPLACRSGSDSL